MMTVMIVTTRKGHGVVSRQTFECTDVREVKPGFLFHDGRVSEEAAIEIDKGDGNVPRYGPHPDGEVRQDFFVMNEAGQTITKLEL